MPRPVTHLRRVCALAAAALLLVALSGPAYADVVPAPAEQPVQLRATAVDQPGDYFEVTLQPGERAELSIELSNQGDEAIETRTYAADVHTIINGGFGAALDGDDRAGATTWLDYTSDVVLLPAGEGLVESFSVSVPEGTPAGEYITSIVLENAEPVAGTGSIALDQTIRQALAVSITVPGPPAPALQIGDAAHSVVAGRSVIAVEVDNPGNVRLLPSGALVVRDTSGAVVVDAPVVMDSFYAFTSTLVEVPLADELDQGSYTVGLELEDTVSGVGASATDLPLVVTAAAGTGDAAGVGSRVAAVVQDAAGAVPTWALLLGAGVVGLLVALAATAAVARVGRTARTRHTRTAAVRSPRRDHRGSPPGSRSRAVEQDGSRGPRSSAPAGSGTVPDDTAQVPVLVGAETVRIVPSRPRGHGRRASSSTR